MNFSRRNETEPAAAVAGADEDFGLVEEFHDFNSA